MASNLSFNAYGHDKPRRIIDARHYSYIEDESDWKEWRLCAEGGRAFREEYLERYTERETLPAFERRKAITPISTPAKSAIRKIKNSLFQRMVDVIRLGGSKSYRKAVAGEARGVDNRGTSMNAFIGRKILWDLLIMGRIGVYVDFPELSGGTAADAVGKHPYAYCYPVERILDWTEGGPESPSDFTDLLIADIVSERHSSGTRNANETEYRYRHVFIDEMTGKVRVEFYNMECEPVDRNGNAAAPGGVELDLTEIPFVMFDIGDSLIKDVCSHQIMSLNLASSDANYALKSNFPFLTRQQDNTHRGQHLGTVKEAEVGPTQGLEYDKGTERPGFISPPSDTLRASMELREQIKQEINETVNLALAELQDDDGLTSGLSFIGLVLESGEKRLAWHWAAYEKPEPDKRNLPTIRYPDQYGLRPTKERIEEVDKLTALMYKLPGRIVKREIAKLASTSLFLGRINAAKLESIHQEIDVADYCTSDPEIIIAAKEQGLVGEQTGSMALGFDDDEYLQAREDHARRAALIVEAQAAAGGPSAGGNPAARGAPDLDSDGPAGADDEKEAAGNTDAKTETQNLQRGEGDL